MAILRDIFYNHFPDLLGGLYFRLGVNLVPEKKRPVDMGGVRRICILATSGTDDLAALTPMIQSLSRGIPDAYIIIALSSDVAKDAVSEVADEVVVLDSRRKLKRIRDDWPDLTIAASPGSLAVAKTAFRTGARYRLGFRYDHKDRSDIGFLFTHTVPLDRSRNETEQRSDLIRPLST